MGDGGRGVSTLRQCIDCGAASSVVFDFAYPIERCLGCGLVYASEWSESFDRGLYDYYADRLDWPVEAFITPLTTTSLDATLRWLAELAPGRRLLDVGCGEGQLVHVAVDQGWQACGIDLSESAVRICVERFGLPCKVVDFFSDDLEDGFDVITMSELIEHVPHPSRFLRRARDLLAPGGIAYLTTPNFNSLGRRVLGGEWGAIGEGHVSYFTPQTLREKATACGLAPEVVQTKNISAAALKRILHRSAPLTATSSELCSGASAEDQALRVALERRRVLRVGKMVANKALRLTGLGETIVAVLRRPT